MAQNGRKYGFSSSLLTNTTAATSTIALVTATTAVRPYLIDFMLSSAATPADAAAEYQVTRFTAPGTTTAVTPTPFDSGDPAATSICGKISTVVPTYSPTVALLDIAHNQRATFRWVAAPGEEIIAPATASNGWGFQCVALGASGFVDVCSVIYGE
jgi:hypothetical protein